MKKLRILLADDHPMLRQGLRTMLEAQPSMQVVGEAANGKEVLAQAVALRPDIVVMDLSMPELNGLQATEALQTQCPQVKVIALTAHDDASYLAEVCRAGAVGYVLKRAAGEELVKAIEAVAKGGVCFEPSLAGQALARQLSGANSKRELPNPALSEREEAVLRLVAWGFSNKEVADKLSLSVKTVETYKLRIGEKLGLRSRTQLVQYALRRGWLNDEQLL
jgi:two-component system, NarL family, response regulator NreC